MKYIELYKNVTGVVTNIDLDGFLSYAIIKKVLNVPLVGFTNSRNHIYLINNKERSLTYDECVFLDFYMNANVRSHDQHIISYDSNHNEMIKNCNFKFNPNIDRDRNWISNYRVKFPLSTCFDVIFRLESENVDIYIDRNKEISPGLYLKDLIFYTDSTWQNAIKYKENMDEWWNYELEQTNNGKLTSELFNYKNELLSDVQKTSDRMNMIKLGLASSFKTTGKTCDGYDINNEYHMDMFNMLQWCCQLCGNESSDVSIKDFDIVNYDYGFTTIDTSMPIQSVDEIIQNCLSYSFVFGPNSQRNFSYTKL